MNGSNSFLDMGLLVQKIYFHILTEISSLLSKNVFPVFTPTNMYSREQTLVWFIAARCGDMVQ